MKQNISYSGYKPGVLADVVKMHTDYYSESWGFGLAFETKVAGELSEFLNRFNPDTDLFIGAYNEQGNCVGSISLDSQHAADKGAHVRWFIVEQHYAGQGIGRKLMEHVVNHCDSKGFASSYLTTFDGLQAARVLYESLGYQLVEERAVDQWSGGVREQLFVRRLAA